MSATKNLDGGIPLAQAATFFYDTLEKHYPNYPDVRSIKLIDKEMVRKIVFFDHRHPNTRCRTYA